MKKVRRTLALLVSLLASLALLSCGEQIPTTAESTFPQPSVLKAQEDFQGNQLIDVDYLLSFQDHVLPNSEGEDIHLRLRTYGTAARSGETPDTTDMADWNFSVPPPTLWFPKPAPNPSPSPAHKDYSNLRLRLNLHNGLTTGEGYVSMNEDGCSVLLNGPGTESPNCLHGFNTTNMHYHGSHADPKQGGDNVLIKVKPGQSFTNDFFFGIKQAPGTHWYHPHKHGSTEQQLANGLAGAIVIEGDLNVKDINPEAQDLVFVIQNLKGDIDFWSAGSEHSKFMYVNGEHNPTLKMRPGEIQRWRMLNAQDEEFSFMIERPEGTTGKFPVLYQIAQDGLQFSPELWETTSQINALNPDIESGESVTIHPELAPGNRADFLAVAPMEPGIYEVKASIPQVTLPGVPPPPDEIEHAFIIEVTGTPVNPDAWQLPDTLPEMPEYLAPITDDEIDGTRELTFSIHPLNGWPSFKINNQHFDEHRIDQEIMVNTEEEWKLINDSQSMHPFHIHVNPFQVIEIYDAKTGELTRLEDDDPRQWHDTVPIPSARFTDATPTAFGTLAEPSYVIVRHRFEDFHGDFVLHCHILGHEDRGMMQTVRIDPPPPPGQ